MKSDENYDGSDSIVHPLKISLSSESERCTSARDDAAQQSKKHDEFNFFDELLEDDSYNDSSIQEVHNPKNSSSSGEDDLLEKEMHSRTADVPDFKPFSPQFSLLLKSFVAAESSAAGTQKC
jgi:hypothetical protein